MKKLLLMSVQLVVLIVPSLLAAFEPNAVRGAKRSAAIFVAYNFVYIFVVLVVWMSIRD